MRQATGSNTPQSGNKVSIQLSLDGHSFSVPALSELPAGEAPVTVELLLPGTMLVPGELFDAERGAEMLAGQRHAADGGGERRRQRPGSGIRRRHCDKPRGAAAGGGEAGLTGRGSPPRAAHPANTAKTVWMSRRAGLLYIKVYDGGELQLAEAIPAATDTDAAYFFERLDGCFPLKEYELRIAGDNPKAARKLLGKRFRQTTCE